MRGTLYLSGRSLGDNSVSFANSDPVNTQKTINYNTPSGSVSEYEIIVNNPSTVTDLTVKVINTQLSLGGSNKDSLITTLSVPKSQSISGTTVDTRSFFVHGVFNAAALKLVVSNDTVLGASDAFTGNVRIREVG